METLTIRKLSLRNLEILFPTILSFALGVFLLRRLESDWSYTLSILFLLIGTIGFIFILIQFLTRIRVDNIAISQVRFGKERKIKFEEVKTFEIYKTGRFGNTKLDKNDLNVRDIKSERIILVSKIEDKKPNPWWKKDSNTISVPFQQAVFNFIESRIKK
ncbi:MAG: hypothetical protein IPG07_16815 [Crocinitomicaceae bacterium]|nr:hypothetical protein [Crocinitomicaceae bacterium]